MIIALQNTEEQIMTIWDSGSIYYMVKLNSFTSLMWYLMNVLITFFCSRNMYSFKVNTSLEIISKEAALS